MGLPLESAVDSGSESASMAAKLGPPTDLLLLWQAISAVLLEARSLVLLRSARQSAVPSLSLCLCRPGVLIAVDATRVAMACPPVPTLVW